VRVGAGATLFPLKAWNDLPRGVYAVQALLMTNRDLWFPGAPGNWMSAVRTVEREPGRNAEIRLDLVRRNPEETLPVEKGLVRYRRFRSEKLSRFWGRDLFVRVGVVLPRTWESEPARRYPVVLDIGGYGSRFTRAEAWSEGSERHRDWMAADAPQLIWITLDGAGPLGDPYQLDSENHGPHGAALVEEILPALEHEFRGVGQPWARFTTGGSTGGWVSFALQVLYPDIFGGCWSGFPDPLDFRNFQLIDLYRDTHAFVNGEGFERPSARTTDGDVKFTMRHEVQYENVLGLGGTFTRSGGQWGAWTAAFAPRGVDGAPVAAWDPRSGEMTAGVGETWKARDLRRVIEENWRMLAPKLRGKLRVWVGEADEYFLNNAVHRMDEALARLQPPAEARFEYGAGKGHGWNPRPMTSMWREMQEVAERGAQGQGGRDAWFKARFLHTGACPHCKAGR